MHREMYSQKVNAHKLAVDILSIESQNIMKNTLENHKLVCDIIKKMDMVNAKQYAAMCIIELMQEETEKAIINPVNYIHRISINLIKTLHCENLSQIANIEQVIANRLAIQIIGDLNLKTFKIIEEISKILIQKKIK